MARLPGAMDAEDAARVFEQVGFRRIRRKGSHEILQRPGFPLTITLVHPEMRVGLLKQCIRKAGMTNGQFMELYSRL
jgi:predicted RNA binding protein YcfA (HicA-like mRNA interferase family)